MIAGLPEESREAAQLVRDAYGEPAEAGPSRLTSLGDLAPAWKEIELLTSRLPD